MLVIMRCRRRLQLCLLRIVQLLSLMLRLGLHRRLLTSPLLWMAPVHLLHAGILRWRTVHGRIGTQNHCMLLPTAATASP